MTSVIKPRCVRISSILVGMLPLFASLLIVMFPMLVGRVGSWQSFLAVFTGYIVLTQPVGLVLAYGLRSGRRWALYLTMFIAAFGIFGAVISFLDAFLVSKFNFIAHGHQLLTIPLSISCISTCPIILYCLTRPDAKAFFLKQHSR